jgi:hypothetical protein
MSVAIGFESDAFEADDDLREPNSDKMARITLLPDDPRLSIDLSWHVGLVGRQRGKRMEKVLARGHSVTIPLPRALSRLGPFTIPRDVTRMSDREKIAELTEFFEEWKPKILLAWGDYPRPRKLSEGQDAIGPSRFPHVEVVVISSDGSESEPFDLHQVYGVGEYDAPHLRPSYFSAPSEADERATLEAENNELAQRLAKLEGVLSVVVANQSKSKAGAQA